MYGQTGAPDDRNDAPPRQGFAPADERQSEPAATFDDDVTEPLELSDALGESSADDEPSPATRPASPSKRQAIPTYDDTAPDPSPGLSIRERLRQSQGAAFGDGDGEKDELVLDTPKPAAIDDAASSTKGGGTLFERMSRLSRGTAKSGNEADPDDDDDKDALEIPRFLNRQNNQ